jgi:hypothetical protein
MEATRGRIIDAPWGHHLLKTRAAGRDGVVTVENNDPYLMDPNVHGIRVKLPTKSGFLRNPRNREEQAGIIFGTTKEDSLYVITWICDYES